MWRLAILLQITNSSTNFDFALNYVATFAGALPTPREHKEFEPYPSVCGTRLLSVGGVEMVQRLLPPE